MIGLARNSSASRESNPVEILAITAFLPKLAARNPLPITGDRVCRRGGGQTDMSVHHALFGTLSSLYKRTHVHL